MNSKHLIIFGILMVLFTSNAYSVIEVSRINTAKQRVIGVGKNLEFTITVNHSVEVNQSNISENQPILKRQFSMKQETRIEDNLVKQLVVRKVTDNNNFNKLVRVVKYVKDDTKKQIMAKELVEMNKHFVNNLDETRDSELKTQIEDYVDTVQDKKPVKLIVQKNQIQKLFNKELDIDSLIEELWK